MPKVVASITELVNELGGPSKAASVLGSATPQKIVNWRATGRIPARFYILHGRQLEAHGLRAPPSLWGLLEEEAAE